MSESKILSRAEFTEAISRGEDDDVMLIERHDAALRADRDNWKDAYDRLHERYQNVSGSADAAEKALDVAKARVQRLTDLVRYQRMELHTERLISDEEYADLAQERGSVARLESYDEIRARFDAEVESLRRERDAARSDLGELQGFMVRQGYQLCDSAACNCNSYHGGHAMRRLDEIAEALPWANGPTILDRVKTLIAERDADRIRVVQWRLKFDSEAALRDKSELENVALRSDLHITVQNSDFRRDQLKQKCVDVDRLTSERDAATRELKEIENQRDIYRASSEDRMRQIEAIGKERDAAIEAGKADKARIEAYRAQVLSWAEAYPEDGFDGIFSRLPPASTESHELRMYRTRASAAMGRHMSACILKTFGEIDAAMQAAQVEKPE